MHNIELTKNMLFHSNFLTSLSSSLTQLFFVRHIKKYLYFNALWRKSNCFSVLFENDVFSLRDYFGCPFLKNSLIEKNPDSWSIGKRKLCKKWDNIPLLPHAILMARPRQTRRTAKHHVGKIYPKCMGIIRVQLKLIWRRTVGVMDRKN